MGAIAYHYDPNLNLIRARAEGAVTFDEMLTYVRSIIDDPAIRPGFVEVVDFEPIEDLVLSYSQLPPFHQVWQNYLAKGCRATLIYAPSEVGYGICRMVQAVVDPEGDQAEVPFVILKTMEELGAQLAQLGIEGPELLESESSTREET